MRSLPIHRLNSSSHFPKATNNTFRWDIAPGHEGFMIFNSSLLWILVTGVGFFYSGMARSKSALSMLTFSLWSISIASIQWLVFGYSLAFSQTSGNPFIGDFSRVFFINMLDTSFPTAKRISELSFCFYQGVTSTLPAALISGALAERARLLPAIVFVFIWNTLVYCPCAYWSLNPNGWSFREGVLDFGGGSPVHVPASSAALVYSFLLGPRDPQDRHNKPHNMLSIVIGTIFIWFGSFGYNAGSAFGATRQAVISCIITNLSGSIGSITWALMDYFEKGKCKAFGFCAGAVAGLIAITPASGYVHPAAAFVFGIVGAASCRTAHRIKKAWKLDDALDVFALHGVSGIVAMILTGIFAQKKYGGDEINNGGWIDGNFHQLLPQILDTSAGLVYSTTVSFLVLSLMNKIPSLKLRMEAEHVEQGMDLHQLGVTCYEYVDDVKIHLEMTQWKVGLGMPVTTGKGLIHHPSMNSNKLSLHHSNHHAVNEDDKGFVLPNGWKNCWY